ncbi:acetyl-CoA acetyltransferase [Microbacterium sp. zg-Y818]|uniref:acetyl-CoA acetyltransferase n=1 Tax=unclassified Microbacterium TaxID=2609290 RepID=UPI00214C47F9|nr:MULTISPECIES: acetyl-CoA acetyltransferase [unclassified Microbacterium]MCR2799327.1 acetyl-CoA acetyltransferase [Microbacterium sp. zg.Y818]WIM21328.1 acetyl-CoA acetyltransferase [Microbacterium sp. zg-Y818]
MTHALRGSAVIRGVAESELGEVGPHRFPLDLLGEAVAGALADAGIAKSEVDGLFTAVGGRMMSNLDVGEYLGIAPSFTDGTMIGGSSFVSHVHHAALALQAGACKVALIAYGSTQRTDQRRPGRLPYPPELPSYEAAARPVHPVTGYALAAARHMHEFGTTREQLAEVAVAARRWAQLNPKAFKRDPLTVEDVLSARVVATPFTTLDCCLVTDGGGAIVMTRADAYTDRGTAPVYVLGAGEAHSHRSISQMPDLTTTSARESGRRAFEMAGLRPADIDVLELYDAFTINPILFLEDLGFCAKGEGGAFVEGGRIAPGGALPVNTNGGGLSFCHPGMYGIFALIEAVRQLRGDAGERQVAGATTALAHGNGGQLSSQVTAILSSEL